MRGVCSPATSSFSGTRPSSPPFRPTSCRSAPSSRDLAIVQTAIYDAVDAIDHNASAFHVHAHARGKTSPVAAAAAAGLVTASSLFPNDTALFQTAYQGSLADVPSGPARTRGIALGTSVGEKTLISRANDGSNAVVNYTPGTALGDWAADTAQIRAGSDAAMGARQTLCPEERLSVSAATSPSRSRQAAAYTAAFNETKDFGLVEQHRTHAPTDRSCSVLGGQSGHPRTSWLLERDSGKRRRISWQHVGPERAALRRVECRSGRRSDRPL